MNIFGLKFKVGWLWIAFCTTWFVRLAGKSFGPFVFIRPKSWDNEGLLVHEVQHTKQFWYSVFHPWDRRYWKSLNRELNAYAVEVLFYPEDKYRAKILVFSSYLAHDYDFGLTQEQAIPLLEAEVERVR